MIKYYEVIVIKTAKGIRESQDAYALLDRHTEKCNTLKEATQYVLENYGSPKLLKSRKKMYRDGKDGTPEHIGYIYQFRNQDWSHDSEEWMQQDWVEVREIKATPVLV